MDLGVVMRGEILADKLADGRAGRRLATWNTRRVPMRLTPCDGWWRGYFPLAGDMLWNPKDPAAPYALIFDPRRWMRIAAVRWPRFRGWRYLASPPRSATPSSDRPFDEASEDGSTLPRTS
jgi:hypothetical protein